MWSMLVPSHRALYHVVHVSPLQACGVIPPTLHTDSSSDVTLPITTEMYYNPKATKSAVIMLVSTSRILPTVSVYPGGAGDGGVVVEVKKDYLVIEIVVPILVLAVFVVVLVCVIGMIICCRLKRTADYKLKYVFGIITGGYTYRAWHASFYHYYSN